MSTLIEVPPRLTQALAQSLGDSDISRWTVEALVLEGVREGLLSTGEAGEFLGLGYFETEVFLKERGVPLVLTDGEFEQDQTDLRAILDRSALR